MKQKQECKHELKQSKLIYIGADLIFIEECELCGKLLKETMLTNVY